jgi:hypothetical protein
MGRSDPIPAGFEIWFGSLNFQATGNDYHMRLLNRDELHPWQSTGPGPVPSKTVADAPTPVQAATTGAMTSGHRMRFGQRSRQARMEWHRAAHAVARMDAPHPQT